jgi:uncharacterized protein YecA (UPF0149 family)
MRPKPIGAEHHEKPVEFMAAGRSQQIGTSGSTGNPMRTRVDPILCTQAIGRNDPCPCGSGKKYKRCCGGATIY